MVTDKAFIDSIRSEYVDVFTYDQHQRVTGINYMHALGIVMAGRLPELQQDIVDNLGNAPPGFKQRMQSRVA